jgi:glycine/D-amino acid oxidase-like deaminating enzyme
LVSVLLPGMSQKIFVVIGSGVIGLTSAIKLKESFPKYDVIVVSKSFAPDTNTSYLAGGLISFFSYKNQEQLV